MAEETAIHHSVNHQEGEGDWDGGKKPFKVTYGKLMMWYFLLSDAFTFSGFLIAYGALRFSMPTWPVPDYVFKTAPFNNLGLGHDFDLPLIFVTIMSFLLIASSVTMVRAVQEGHRENKRGVVVWMFWTIIGGIGFLSCQAWEWTNLIAVEHMSVTTNPFGTHIESGVYLAEDGTPTGDVFTAGTPYLIHKVGAGHHGAEDDHGGDDHGGSHYEGPGDYKDAYVDEKGYIHKKFQYTSGLNEGELAYEAFGPKAFGALFYFITGFHGFHVFSGVVFLIIIMINAASGLYVERKNGYEMVEKIGLYWHFVDLVWVFVFLVFYLL